MNRPPGRTLLTDEARAVLEYVAELPALCHLDNPQPEICARCLHALAARRELEFDNVLREPAMETVVATRLITYRGTRQWVVEQLRRGVVRQQVKDGVIKGITVLDITPVASLAIDDPTIALDE